MAVYVDDEGNETEVDFTPDQVKEMQQKAEESSKKLEELEAKIKEGEAELQKLRDKDMNFGRFREKTEEERKAFEEKLKGDNKVIYDELKALREEREAEKEKKFAAAKANILKQLAGDNEDLKKSIEARASDFVGDVLTEEDLESRFRNALTLIEGAAPKSNPLYRVNPVTGFSDPDGKEPDFMDTQKGKETYKTLFGTDPINPKDIN